MKIGIITPAKLPVPAVYGGAIETLIDNFIKENERISLHEIVVFSEYEKRANELSIKYLKTKFIWFNNGFLFLVLNLIFRVLKKLKIVTVQFKVFFAGYYIKKYKLDLVLVEGNPVYVKYLKSLLRDNCKIIFHIHSRLIETSDGHLVNALEFSDKVIVVSEFIKSDFLKRFDLDSFKFEVVYNCAGQSFFNSRFGKESDISLKHNLGISEDDFVLIFAGRLVPDKGLLELIKACKMLIGKINFKLICIGSFGSGFAKGNGKKDKFREMVQNEINGLEQNFIFCGYISNDNIPEYYSLADIAVVPSLCEEAAGLVAIEAMCAALPVIYSDRGGIKEYVSKNCGIEIDIGAEDSIEKIAAAIIELNGNTELRRKASFASLNRARLFSPHVFYERLNDVFPK